jgi:hypothetical protein
MSLDLIPQVAVGAHCNRTSHPAAATSVMDRPTVAAVLLPIPAVAGSKEDGISISSWMAGIGNALPRTPKICSKFRLVNLVSPVHRCEYHPRGQQAVPAGNGTHQTAIELIGVESFDTSFGIVGTREVSTQLQS